MGWVFLSAWLGDWFSPACLEKNIYVWGFCQCTACPGMAVRGLGHLLCYSLKISFQGCWLSIDFTNWIGLKTDSSVELSFSSHSLLNLPWVHRNSQHIRTFAAVVHIRYNSCTQQRLLDKLGFDSSRTPAAAQVNKKRTRVHSFLQQVPFSWTYPRAGRWSNMYTGEWTVLCWKCDQLLLLIWTNGFGRSLLKRLDFWKACSCHG